MEPNILDLRKERCPMALLLAKRHTKRLAPGEVCDIYIADPSSKRDIEKYLTCHHYSVEQITSDGFFLLRCVAGEIVY